MADLFDVSVGGVGWHFTSHLVALAALFIACFAIAGYITFRKDSIPGDALKDHDVDVEDITGTTLDISGVSKLQGGIVLGSTAVTDPFQLTKPEWTRTGSGQRLNAGLKGYNFFELDAEVGVCKVDLASAGDAASSTLALNHGVTDFNAAYILTTHTDAGDGTEVCATGSNFRCTTGKPWWIECQFALPDHDATEFFFGVAEEAFDTDEMHLTAAGNGADRVGFVKVDHGDDDVTAAITNGATGSVDQALTTPLSYDADSDILTLGIHWDGAGKVNFYANDVATGATPGNMTLRYTDSTAANQSSDATMLLRFYIQNGGAAAESANINYIRGLQTV